MAYSRPDTASTVHAKGGAPADATEGGRPRPYQSTLDDLGTPLVGADMVVVDLETTGGSPGQAGITEIGAVRVRGGQVVGEFATLVNPGEPVPAFIAALTGITTGMIADAPSVRYAVSMFLDFARDAILVAHNAPYDMGFLRAACSKHGLVWPRPTVVDTAKIARATLLADEVPNNKLATLARHVGATVQPTHRALDDARATVDVLHYLIGRVGDLGVTTVEELASLSSGVRREQRRKRTLADGLPAGPGVYSFIGPDERVLYVGKSAGVRARVRSYFTAAEKRSRMAEMVRIAERVDVIECATSLEAEVREARLIAEHRPAYNRRSKFPDKQCWIRLTDEPFPRLSVVRMPSADDPDLRRHLGPFPSRTAARAGADALAEVFSLRTCTDRIPMSAGRAACAAAELGRCPAPCDGSISVADYASIADRLTRTWTQDFSPVEEWFRAAMSTVAAVEQFERAARLRHRLTALAGAVARADRYRALAGCSQITAGRWVDGRGWEVHVIRHGRLAGAALSPPRQDPISTVATLDRTSEDVPPPPLPMAAASADEVAALWRWLTSDGVRLISVRGELTSRSRGAARVAQELQEAGRRWQPTDPDIDPHTDRRHVRKATAPRPRRATPDPRRVSRIAS